MDWIHCNTCFTSPSASHPTTFCLSSCGHLFCANCINKKDTVPGSSTGDVCRVCKKKCGYMEVNRSLRQDLQALFKQPRELLNQYLRTMKGVIEFQTFHRSHLQKHLNDKANKASKFVKQAQTELARRAEREQMLANENAQLKADLEKQAELIRSLENLIAEKDRELAQSRQRSASRPQKSAFSQKSKAHPNLNGNTPLSTLSFIGCTTSTPICEMQLFGDADAQNGGSRTKNAFAKDFDLQKDFEARDGGGGLLPGSPGGLLNTPAMLGISPQQFTSNRVGGGNFF